MNVALTTEQTKWIKDQVKSGTYSNDSEVVRAAVRSLQRGEHDYKRIVEALEQCVSLVRARNPTKVGTGSRKSP